MPRFIRWYNAAELQILRVRPGLTGPGQIFYTQAQKSADTDADDPESHYASRELHPKLAIDLDYLRCRGVLSDLAIVFRTAWLLTGLRSFTGGLTEDGARPAEPRPPLR